MPSLESSIRALHCLGWSAGDIGFGGPGDRFTLVVCHRGDQVVSVKAPTAVDAWQLAVEQARQLDSGPCEPPS